MLRSCHPVFLEQDNTPYQALKVQTISTELLLAGAHKKPVPQPGRPTGLPDSGKVPVLHMKAGARRKGDSTEDLKKVKR